ncbi:MAG: hypothetical protein EOO13_12435 [Chitinophagaceae bacterium]|nr:MAG: hypothetical protein EOO13_12435 [Chitinophagaceae bacterium]
MNKEDILKSDLLDLIFDKRNKNYGAYELRKHYKRRLLKSLAIAFVLTGGIAAFISFAKEEKLITRIFDIEETENVALAVVELPKKPEVPKVPETPKPPTSAQKVPQERFLENMVITDDPTEADKLPSNLDNAAIGSSTTTEGVYTGRVYVDPPAVIDAGGGNVPAKIDRETPRAVVDIMPSYPGGINALRKFLEKNLKSFDDIETGASISVKITFIVGYDGKLKGFQLMEDGGDMYNKEVIRVLKKMPEWIPGKAQGENVSVYYTIPVKFTSSE